MRTATLVLASAVIIGAFAGCVALQNPPDYQAAAQLLDKGGDVNRADDHGLTPLHYVARCWHSDAEAANLIGLYLAHGANPNARDKGGRTPLFECYDARPLCVQTLLRGGADPYLTDSHGVTAIETRYRRLYAGRQRPIEEVAFVRFADDAKRLLSPQGSIVMPALRVTDKLRGAVLYDGPKVVAKTLRAAARGRVSNLEPPATAVQVLPGSYEIAWVPVGVVVAGGSQASVVGTVPGKPLTTSAEVVGGQRYSVSLQGTNDSRVLTISSERSVTK